MAKKYVDDTGLSYFWSKAKKYIDDGLGKKANASHTHSYTQLTGSTTTANQAIVSNGTANGWTLKTIPLTGYVENGKNYPVELSEGKMFVNVPWTDTNTTYTTATSTTLGLVKIGYTKNEKNYPVELSNGQMFVNVPWTDTNTTYSPFKGASSTAAGGSGLVPAPAQNQQGYYLKGDGTWGAISIPSVGNGKVIINQNSASKGSFTLNQSGNATINLTDTNTTYTFANGSDGSFTVTPSGGSGQKVTVGKPATAGTADKVANSFIIKINSATSTEGTNIYTYNGSAAKTIDIKAGSNVTLTPSAGALTIAAKDTTYGLASTTANGLLRQLNSSTTQFMRGDGNWATVDYNSLNNKPAINNPTITITQNGVSKGSFTLNQSGGATIALTDTNTTYGIATNTTAGLVKPWFYHTAASTGPTAGTNSTAVTVNTITTTAGRYYAIEADNAGRGFVNVPWTDTTYNVATQSANGLMSATDKKKLDGLKSATVSGTTLIL